MRRFGKIVLSLCLLVGLSSVVHAEMVDRIIAKVGSSIIMKSDVAQGLKMKRAYFFMKHKPAQAQKLFKDFQKNIVNEMILDHVLAHVVVKNNVTVSDAEIDQELGIRINSKGLSLTGLQAKLKSYGVTLEDYKSLIRYDLEKQAFIQKVIVPNISISDYDLQKEYQKIKNDFLQYNQLRFIEVILIQEKFTSEEAMMNMAEKIRGKLKSGLIPKDDIKQHSFGAYAEKGGDSGLVNAKDLRPEITQILSRMKKNEVSRIMPFGPGVFLFKLLDKKDPEPMPFSKVVNVVRAKYAEKIVEQNDRLKESIKVLIE